MIRRRLRADHWVPRAACPGVGPWARRVVPVQDKHRPSPLGRSTRALVLLGGLDGLTPRRRRAGGPRLTAQRRLAVYAVYAVSSRLIAPAHGPPWSIRGMVGSCRLGVWCVYAIYAIYAISSLDTEDPRRLRKAVGTRPSELFFLYCLIRSLLCSRGLRVLI